VVGIQLSGRSAPANNDTSFEETRARLKAEGKLDGDGIVCEKPGA
jgi:hypothetical protein